MKMSSKKKIAAVVLTTVALSIGSVGVASASQTKSKSASVRTTITKTSVNAIGNPMAGQMMGGREAHEANRVADQGTRSAERAAHEALIATTIGIDAATIKSRLAAGETLGAIAGTKKAALITVLVDEASKKIDAAVAAGRMTAAQATTLKAGLTAHITAEIDSVRGAMGPGKGGPGMGGRGHGDMGGNRGMGMKP